MDCASVDPHSVTASNITNTALHEKLNFNFVRDITPVASINRLSLIMPVTPSLLPRPIGGQVQVMFGSLIEHINDGKLRALALTTAMPSEALSDVPTVSDFVPGLRRARGKAWIGSGATKALNRPSIPISTRPT
jgi:tripartite-type tricarboxylate transporter receptor subunit TctC